MLDAMRQALLALGARAQTEEIIRDTRRLRGLAISLFRKPEKIGDNLADFQETIELHARETASWITPERMKAGERGPFDACDLRIWILLAEAASVPFVPAREILRLSEDELASASGFVGLPDDLVTRGLRRRMATVFDGREEAHAEAEAADVDPDRLEERLYAAMDDVPEGWMVRGVRSGSLELKALAGAGLAGPQAPEVRFGPSLEVGPGWIRHGNRRRVNVSDNRTISSFAQGPGGDAVFVARPWVEAARFALGPDPHRHGTPFAGKGMWPAEWRAFVERGKVVGISSYYGWCGNVSRENALVAMEVRDLAQAIVDQARLMGMIPRYMDVEFARAAGRPEHAAALELFAPDQVACTLDFIEVKDRGLMLLEGGPPNTPFGGGHPCAFAGCGGLPKFGNKTITEGVAFRLMPHVVMADPRTWEDGERSDCILSWEEVEALASRPVAEP